MKKVLIVIMGILLLPLVFAIPKDSKFSTYGSRIIMSYIASTMVFLLCIFNPKEGFRTIMSFFDKED